ncbi:MAG: hypothetical protein UV92_C0011G0014 [Parcubacteria group bacterium GW2011_GWA1_43_27]|nr:MAG: hypothetical protein UV47_C0011G0005 [Parcubacteria group bacterium GW2011_GWA2_42_80]KKT13943.1 MAG: hypothetical protein UV92_C0011G0014 [Parcubacteria group bacterium GW2011_GWA1_43_27]KKT22409.1 MAG: hypothetical protein UW06_C0011G0015 [Parcubacteria group bacterium GW2011_GWE1_43_8]HBZ36761.1 hypothetical protein [Candidatus Veblenbacteria bacterium]
MPEQNNKNFEESNTDNPKEEAKGLSDEELLNIDPYAKIQEILPLIHPTGNVDHEPSSLMSYLNDYNLKIRMLKAQNPSPEEYNQQKLTLIRNFLNQLDNLVKSRQER